MKRLKIHDTIETEEEKLCMGLCMCFDSQGKKKMPLINKLHEQMHSFIYANDKVQCPAHHAPDVIKPVTTALLCGKLKYSHSTYITSHFHMKFFVENIPVEINIQLGFTGLQIFTIKET